MKEVEIEAIAKYGAVNQTMVAIEEMSELTKELIKCIRGQKNRNHLVEEMADVYIMLDQIQIIYGIEFNEIIKVMEEKVKRLKRRMDQERESV